MIERLQIYKTTYALTIRLYKALPQMEKMHKHIIGKRILETSLELFKWVSLANQAREKDERLGYLKSYLSAFEELKTLLRICNDIKLLKLSTITEAQVLLTDISKQLSGWIGATSRMWLQSESQSDNFEKGYSLSFRAKTIEVVCAEYTSNNAWNYNSNGNLNNNNKNNSNNVRPLSEYQKCIKWLA